MAFEIRIPTISHPVRDHCTIALRRQIRLIIFSFRLKTHILCLLAGVVHHDCIQYTALIVVAHIKGWSYLSVYGGLSLSEVCLDGARTGENEYKLIKCSLFYLNYMNILI